jgi:hypothetical protein
MKREQEANPKLEPLEKGLDLCLEIEELEPIIAPGMRLANSNETLVTDPEELELELEIEDLEPRVAPGIWENSNETLVTDREED